MYYMKTCKSDNVYHNLAFLLKMVKLDNALNTLVCTKILVGLLNLEDLVPQNLPK
jgi:hypothetical protein